MLGQAGKHIIHERGDLLVRRVKDFTDAVNKRGNNQGKRVIERDVRKLVHDGVEYNYTINSEEYPSIVQMICFRQITTPACII